MRYGKMRYKRYGRRRSTNVIRMKFQSFMDISTSDSSMQIITISAGGANILKRLPAQFSAYKYYKLGNVSAKLVPASTLPCDPTGLSYEAGETTVDPRDQLSPGLVRITNGEDIMENITNLSDTEQRAIYNSMMLDPRWFKWMLQSGVKRFGKPRYWTIGQLHQDKWPGSITNIPIVDAQGACVGTANQFRWAVDGSSPTSSTPAGSSPNGFFQTGHRGVLGWLPTDGLSHISPTSDKPLLASPPEIELFKLVLPKAYKTRYYYRVFITEEVLFREPIVMGSAQYRPLDIFHYPAGSYPALPNAVHSADNYAQDEDTGGNYGDD